MMRTKHIRGAVLPTVTVVSVLLLLAVLAVTSLWDADFLFFSRQRYETMMRAHIESGFVLYDEYPSETVASLRRDSTLVLYDSVPSSRIRFGIKPWGLYEVVSVSDESGKIHASKIVGKRSCYKGNAGFYYKDNNTALTLAGKINLKSKVILPSSGVIYGQMGSTFFSGEKIDQERMETSGKELPEPAADALSVIRELKATALNTTEYLSSDSLHNTFYVEEPVVVEAGESLEYCILSGNIVLTAEEIVIGASCRLSDIVVTARKVTIREGFSGSLQVFASDSVKIENDVTLGYPSGVYSETYIGIGNNSCVNGYAIVNLDGKPDVRKANYEQSRLSTVRGMVYVSGTAQLQGIVNGPVFIGKAVYYSPRGYYENMLCDATVLENAETAFPFWLEGPPERKEAKWVN